MQKIITQDAFVVNEINFQEISATKNPAMVGGVECLNRGKNTEISIQKTSLALVLTMRLTTTFTGHDALLFLRGGASLQLRLRV